MGLTVLMLGLDIAKRLRLARWPATRRAGNDVLGAGVRHPPRRWPESVSEMWLLYTATYVWKLHLWGALWGAASRLSGRWSLEARQRPAARPAGAAMGAARHTQEPTRVAVAAAKVLNFTVQLYGGVYYCADRCTLHVQLFRESRTDPSTERRVRSCIQVHTAVACYRSTPQVEWPRRRIGHWWTPPNRPAP